MPLAFLFAGGIPWRLIGITVGIILVAACWLEFTHIDHLDSQLNVESRIANDNAVMAENARQAMDRANMVAAQTAQDARVFHKKLSVNKRKIVDAPQTDDGPLAPVLRRTLDELPGQSGDEIDAHKHASAPGEPDDMRGRP